MSGPRVKVNLSYTRALADRGVVHLAPGDVAGYGERQPSPGDLPEEADPDLDGESRAVLAPVGPFRGDGLPGRQPAPQPGDTLGQQDRLDSVTEQESNSSRV